MIITARARFVRNMCSFVYLMDYVITVSVCDPHVTCMCKTVSYVAYLHLLHKTLCELYYNNIHICKCFYISV